MNKVKVFDAYYKNKAGIWYFVPEDFSLFIKNEPVSGFGSIKYPEGSVYVGEIFFDGKDFKKQGIGQQDFTYSELGHLDENINEKIYKFIGKFDYKKMIGLMVMAFYIIVIKMVYHHILSKVFSVIYPK